MTERNAQECAGSLRGLKEGSARRDHLHICSLPAVSRNRKAASDDFPQNCEIRINFVNALRASVGQAKTGDDFVEDQQGLVFSGSGAPARWGPSRLQYRS